MANTKKNNINYNMNRKINVNQKKINNNYKNIQKKKLVSGEEMVYTTRNDLTTKERNRERYEARKRKYSQNTKKMKKVLNVEELDNKINDVQKEESKKVLENTDIGQINVNGDTKKNKEKIQKNDVNKNSGIKDTKLLKIIEDIKEKTSDNLVPIGSEKKDNKLRVKRYLKEALFYAIIVTLINGVVIYFFDYANIIRLFDIRLLNVSLTIILSLVFNFAGAFFIDCLVTEIWVKIKEKRKVGEQNGDSGIK